MWVCGYAWIHNIINTEYTSTFESRMNTLHSLCLAPADGLRSVPRMSLGTDVSIPISPARCQIRPVQVKDEGVSINPAQLDLFNTCQEASNLWSFIEGVWITCRILTSCSRGPQLQQVKKQIQLLHEQGEQSVHPQPTDCFGPAWIEGKFVVNRCIYQVLTIGGFPGFSLNPMP